ncbi:membrane protein [Bacteroidia bacterium]|nr:membrane protein [Bacteroidia bacterium]
MKTTVKTWHWHVIAIAFFLALTSIYFSPVVFDGKGLPQGDITSGLGWGKDARDYHQQTGEYSFWSNAMFGGMPGNYTGGMPATFNIFSYISKVFILNLPGLHLGLVFIYMFGFYIFLLSIGCKPWMGIVGAVAYAFASYNLIIIDAGHVSKGLAMATMAPVLGGVILTYRGKYLWGALTTLIFTGINIVYNHQQISYYLLLTIAVLAIVYFVYAVKEHTLKRFFTASLILVAAAGIAALPALGRLIPTMDYTKESMRGGAVLQSKSNDTDAPKNHSGLNIDYAFQWSYGKIETFTLLIPNFYGASSHYNLGTKSKTYEALKGTGQGAQFVRYAPTYWGDQPFTSGPVYAGAIICFLFILGLYLVNEKEKWWLLIATMLSVFLSWGRNFPLLNDVLFYHLPFYNKFRTPSMSLVIANVTMVIMAILALRAIVEQRSQKGFLAAFKRPFLVSLGVTGGLCLLFIVFGGAFDFACDEDMRYPDWLVTALQADRHSMLTSDAFRSLFFILAAAGLIWLFVKNKLKLSYLAVGLGALILIDMWVVDKRFLNNNSFVPQKQVKAITPTEVDLQILQDKDPDYRVMNLASNTFNESRTSYFHKTIGGYSPAKLRRYQDIIDYHLSGKDMNMNVINMLNTRYFIVPNKEGGQHVQRNPDAMGNCWFVDTLRWVDNPNEEIVALRNFDPTAVAIIDTVWRTKLPADLPQFTSKSDAAIALTDYKPGNLHYQSNNTQQQLAVFSEVFYKTWNAYIDGQPVPLVRVNYILRALAVPAGEHRIEFKCVDELALKSVALSKWGSIFVAIVLAGLIGLLVVQNKKKKQAVI